PRPAERAGYLLAALELEGHLDLGAVRLDLAVLHLHVLLHHLGDAQIPEALRGLTHGRGCGLLPGFRAGPDQLDDLVDALGHCLLTFPPAPPEGRLLLVGCLSRSAFRRRSALAPPRAGHDAAGQRLLQTRGRRRPVIQTLARERGPPGARASLPAGWRHTGRRTSVLLPNSDSMRSTASTAVLLCMSNTSSPCSWRKRFSPASTLRTPSSRTHEGSSAGVVPQSPVSAAGPKPHRQASGMPWTLPLGESSLVLKSACASSHSTRSFLPCSRQYRATAPIEPTLSE